MAKYVYTYKEFDSSFKLLSMLHTVPRTIYRKIEIDTQLKTSTTELYKDRKQDKSDTP